MSRASFDRRVYEADVDIIELDHFHFLEVDRRSHSAELVGHLERVLAAGHLRHHALRDVARDETRRHHIRPALGHSVMELALGCQRSQRNQRDQKC